MKWCLYCQNIQYYVKISIFIKNLALDIAKAPLRSKSNLLAKVDWLECGLIFLFFVTVDLLSPPLLIEPVYYTLLDCRNRGMDRGGQSPFQFLPDQLTLYQIINQIGRLRPTHYYSPLRFFYLPTALPWWCCKVFFEIDETVHYRSKYREGLDRWHGSQRGKISFSYS